MGNNVAAGKGEEWASVLQSVLREKFVGINIANTKFEGDFNGNDTVHFPRLAKITTLDLATSYSDVTIQNLIESDETFTLDYRKHFAFELSDEDRIELRADPESQAIQDGAEAFAGNWDDTIMSQHANALYTIDDGDMETSTNGGAGNPIKLSKTNIYDMLTALNEKFDDANVPMENRSITLSPKEKRLLSNSSEFQRASDLGDQVARKGFFGEADNLKVYISNNLVSAGGIKHALGAQGKPICFASNIKPKVQIVGSEVRENFADLVKAQSKYGSKTFTEGAERLADVEIYTT